MLNRLAVCGILLGLVVGCSGADPGLTKQSPDVNWPALADLRDPEIHMPLLRSAQMNDAAGVKSAATNPKLEERLAKFESEPIPKQFASSAREAAKTKVVDIYKSLLEKAKGDGSAKELKDIVDGIGPAIGELTKPDLK